MKKLIPKPTIGVMGSANLALNKSAAANLKSLATRLGRAITDHGCTLITGATTGFPDLVSRAARSAGAITIGVSPAQSREEHLSRYLLPEDGAAVIIYTGFGLKGRNVVNVRSSDIVIIVGGGIGTLNEFTIAFDEGKVIGVLEGTGGVADQIREIAQLSGRKTTSEVVFDSNPENLVDTCLQVLGSRQSQAACC
ncbi:MAG TPA: hypothetical protein VN937_05765 [Blastocatellia bacterium]|nr:hypothetical protein [Blastocatellia bacterium]